MLASTHYPISKTMEIPVLISGAGPTGLYAAILLQKMNIPFRLIERDLAVSPLSKALGIHARSQEILQMTDAQLMDRFVEEGFAPPSFHIYYGGKLTNEINVNPSKESHYAKMLMLRQDKTNQIFIDALEKLGDRVDRGWELVDTKVVEEENGDEKSSSSWVETTIRRVVEGSSHIAAGPKVYGTIELVEDDSNMVQYEYELVKSQYLIGADGGRSAVRHKINMPFPGRTRDFSLIIFDGVIDTTIDLSHVNVINGNNNRNLAALPVGEPNRVRVMFDNGVLTPEEFEQQKSETLTVEHFQQLLDKATAPLSLKIQKTYWLTYYRVNERRAQEYSYKGRIFLAGDAAHIHSPAGGQGLNTGLQDAYNLAWKIAMVVNGTAPQKLLDSYNEERPAIGDEIIALSSKSLEDSFRSDFIYRAIRRLAIALSPILMPLMAKGEPTLSMLGLRYHGNSLNKTHKSQPANPSAPGAIGRRAGDAPLAPFVARFDSGHNSIVGTPSVNSAGSDSDNETATMVPRDNVTRLHELMAHPGVWQVLVFTGNQWRQQQIEATQELVKSMNHYLAKWRSTWPTSTASLRPQFMVHTLTTVAPEKASSVVEMFSAKKIGEGKAFLDIGKVLHGRYGVELEARKNVEEGAIVVVRPDSHISYRVLGTGNSAWEDVNEYFESILV